MQQSFDILAVTEIKTLKKFKNSVATPEKREQSWKKKLYYFITLTESHNTTYSYWVILYLSNKYQYCISDSDSEIVTFI